MDRINELVAMSHKYGSNPALVLAGGGNTSYKNEENIYGGLMGMWKPRAGT